MNEYAYRLALEGDQWAYSNSSLADVLTRAQKMSRMVPDRSVVIQRVEVINPEDCFQIKRGHIQKGGMSYNNGINSAQEQQCTCAENQGGPCSHCMEEKFNI